MSAIAKEPANASGTARGRSRQPATATVDPAALITTIKTLASLLDDLEKTRIANANRIGAMEREQGEALPHLHFTDEQLQKIEHEAELELVRAWRHHPLAPWAKSVRGLGEKSIARLIAEIGDPSIGSVGHWETTAGAEAIASTSPSNEESIVRTTGQNAGGSSDLDATIDNTKASGIASRRDRRWIVDSYYDRSLRQLWSYAGLGDPARSKIPKNATQAELLKRGRPGAKKQLYLIATSMLKAGNRDVYDVARAEYANRIHDAPCAQCKAKAGDPWKLGHQHAAALRKVAKEFLRDLWAEARKARGL